FRGELASMTRDFTRSLLERREIGDSRLTWAVLLGTIPVGLAGLFLGDSIEMHTRSPLLIGTTTVLFGLLLWLADRRPGSRSEHRVTWLDIVVIGTAQALALIPGTSRSGVTIAVGLLVGLSRDGAARFSFLLAIPVTALAAGYKLIQLGAAPGTV